MTEQTILRPGSTHERPAHQIDLFCVAFAIRLYELQVAPNGGSARDYQEHFASLAA